MFFCFFFLRYIISFFFFFFFQAEDGIRDHCVTGVQTCALPISGGDLRVFGKQPEPIYVRHPRSPGKLVHIGQVTEAAVASSRAYFSAAEFFDPRTGKIVRPGYGITVIALDCTTADALTKPCLLEPNRSNGIAARFGALAVVMQ